MGRDTAGRSRAGTTTGSSRRSHARRAGCGPAGAERGRCSTSRPPASTWRNVEQLLGLLVEEGRSVIEHHQAVMAHADWIIDRGPGADNDGGRVVFEGTPADSPASTSRPYVGA
jgi:hypothetical protein